MPVDNKVVSLTGGWSLPVPGTIDEDLVKFLQELVEKAKSGEIIGIAGSCVYPSNKGTIMPADSFKVGWTDSYATIGGLEDAKFRVLKRLNP